MKILSLNIIAYGSFTDTNLDFTNDGRDFHVIYGPNEAGKSTALKALRHMLFGIPVRTSASFLHPHPTLRIGGRLVKSDGAQIEFVRRKGRAKTLRDADDQVLLDDNALAPYLGGVDSGLFEQMFAIGHEELVRGGEEIIAGAGSVGESLFAAGAGLIQLQAMRQALDTECNTLFRQRGSKPKINKTLAALKETNKKKKEALLLVRTWKSHDQALQEARRRLESIHQKLAALKQESGKLERIGKALPLIVRIREVNAELADFEGVPLLPEDFGEKRRQAVNDLEIAENDLARAERTIETLKDQLATIRVPERILDNADLIERLQHDLGSYRKAQKDRPGLEARIRSLARQVTEKLSETALGELVENNKDLKLPPSTIGEIRELNKAFEYQTALQESAAERLRKTEAHIDSLMAQREKMALPVDVTALQTEIQTVQGAGPVENQYSKLLLAIETKQKNLDGTLKRLPLWNGSPEAIDTLPCPSMESITHFEAEFTALQRQIDKLRDESQTIMQDIAQIQAELDAIQLSRKVPVESDLERARAVRKDGWRLVRLKLENRDPADEVLRSFTGQFDGNLTLPDAFEKSVVRADHIADRLRREAEQVSRKSVLESRKNQREKAREALEKDLATVHAKRAEFESEWQKRWQAAGIDPMSPREMHTWLADVQIIREKAADLSAEKLKAETMASEIESMKKRLVQALSGVEKSADISASLSHLVGIGMAHVTSQEKRRSQIEKIDDELINRRSEKEEVQAALADLEKKRIQWEDRWAESMAKIGVASDASPAATMIIIENIREAKALSDEADILKKRIDGIERDAGMFRQQVTRLVDALSPALGKASPERVAVMLNTRLIEARELLSAQKNMRDQLDVAKTDRMDAEKRVADARTLLDSLCRQAHCKGPGELEQVETRSRTRQRLISERIRIEARLRELSAGATVETFIASAGLVRADRINPALELNAGKVKKLEEERSTLEQTIGARTTQLTSMDGSAKAAEYAEKKQELLATLESDVERYVRFKIASVLLTRTIEQYREKHQGPLIKRASELFSQMTAGAFDGIRTEYDEKDHPVMVGIRTGENKMVPVVGMSDGTADQLYLALRLASLEQYLLNHEPLPFIVDDILLRFDDERSAATLNVLGDLSRKTQVIFFTHHPHLVNLARNNIDPEMINHHILA